MWFRGALFGYGGGNNASPPHISSINAEAVDEEGIEASSPSNRLRKRNKRNDDGLNNNYTKDGSNDANQDGLLDDISLNLDRRLRNTSLVETNDGHEALDESLSTTTTLSDDGALNITVDTVENPILDYNQHSMVTNSIDLLGEDGEGEMLYASNDGIKHHVEVDHKHWRNMKWDSDGKKFYYDSSDIDAHDGIPAANEYKIVRPSDPDAEVRVVFNISRETMLASYKEEYEQVLNRLEQLGGAEGKTIDGITNLLFGPDSRLVQILAKRLKKDKTDVHKFLATFFFAAEFRTSAKRLHEHPDVITDEYMDETELNSFWNDIAAIGKDGNEPTYLWQSVEDALNDDCRDIFLTIGNQTHVLRVALDDDKVHFQFSTFSVINDKSFLCGLSPQQHVKQIGGDSPLILQSRLQQAIRYALEHVEKGYLLQRITNICSNSCLHTNFR